MIEALRCSTGSNREKYKRLLRLYERFFVALVGHEHNEVRDDAIRMLNSIYDQLDWQYTAAYSPVLRYVDILEITFCKLTIVCH